MKEKILMLIIGMLIGAIITAGCFFIFSKDNVSSNEFGVERQQVENFKPDDIPNDIPRNMQNGEKKIKGKGFKNNEQQEQNSNI